ncbi:conjugative transposon protein TraN [Mucilaginibacter sp. OK098]|uniref:conjugative transposon protein TraN n=1 Tax=Mucilaginibacter sp. OK098 TaxID=1855297 RepID=UPI00091E36D9|nr:conjugative transposon protein TraN [Mucilaginibacter sp. OK098]SHM92597.1 Bacteroides conjugative transposon TraN protein [Mucilaginibacter sp. OK098]
MKKLLPYLFLLLAAFAHAQEKLPVVYLPENLTVHFISPEPVQYVDISDKNLIGDLPLKNVLRIKLKDSLKSFTGSVITIAGEKFIAQYQLLPGSLGVPTEINILPADTRPLDISGIGLSQNQLKLLCLKLYTASSEKKLDKVKAFGLKGQVNHIATLGDYIFLDIAFKNKTNLRYDIEDFRFKIDDKKVTKASNIQSVEISPVFVLSGVPSFSKYYRNVFVFKKMSFPGNKVLHTELSEKQISGRVVTLTINYKDLLEADTIDF